MSEQRTETPDQTAHPTEPGRIVRPPTRSMVAVVEHVYHQQHGRQPREMVTRYQWSLESNEQAYERHLVVGEAWTKLDRGWIECAETVCLRNDEGSGFLTVPTREQVEEARSMIVEVGVLLPVPEEGRRTAFSPPRLPLTVLPLFLVKPGKSCRLPDWIDLDRLMVRCPNGRASCVLHLIPA